MYREQDYVKLIQSFSIMFDKNNQIMRFFPNERISSNILRIYSLFLYVRSVVLHIIFNIQSNKHIIYNDV